MFLSQLCPPPAFSFGVVILAIAAVAAPVAPPIKSRKMVKIWSGQNFPPFGPRYFDTESTGKHPCQFDLICINFLFYCIFQIWKLVNLKNGGLKESGIIAPLIFGSWVDAGLVFKFIAFTQVWEFFSNFPSCQVPQGPVVRYPRCLQLLTSSLFLRESVAAYFEMVFWAGKIVGGFRVRKMST